MAAVRCRGRGRLKEESANATRAPARAGGLGLAVLLTLLVAMGPVSTDLYLPSLPGIARDLSTGQGLAQLTIGLFIAGFAAMMLVCGPLADRFGRRPVLLWGMALYTLASIACALAADIAFLLAARFVQALGACVGPVIGRAIVRDLYEPREAGRILGYMGSAMALAPLIGAVHRRLARGRFRLARQLPGARGLWRGLLVAALALRLDETLRTPLTERAGPAHDRQLPADPEEPRVRRVHAVRRGSASARCSPGSATRLSW